MKKTLLAVCAVFTLNGCSSVMNTGDTDKFDCPGMPNGIVCKGPREVYGLTNGDAGEVTQGSLEKTKTMPNDKIVDKKTPPATVPLTYTPGDAGVQPEPLVTQTKVLRIWVAPWVDKSNNLHWPGLMFAKIQTSEWNFGQDNFEGVDPPIPHLIDSTAETAPAPQSQNQGQQPEPGIPQQ